MITLILIGICVLIIVLFVRHVKNAGFWDSVHVEVVERPQLIGRNLEIFYQHHVGSYSNSGDYIKEIKSLVPEKNLKVISVYYDNPKDTKEELCQSICGVVYAVDDNVQFDQHFATNLTRWGYERIRIPAVERSVICQQRFNGFFSYLHLIWHVYPKLTKFFNEQRLESNLTIEVLSDTKLTIFCPLDHVEDFRVPEVIPTDKLEEKLALNEFQTSSNDESDEENSSEFDDEHVEDDNSQLMDA